jgi:hypothetical protein
MTSAIQLIYGYFRNPIDIIVGTFLAAGLIKKVCGHDADADHKKYELPFKVISWIANLGAICFVCVALLDAYGTEVTRSSIECIKK